MKDVLWKFEVLRGLTGLLRVVPNSLDRVRMLCGGQRSQRERDIRKLVSLQDQWPKEVCLGLWLQRVVLRR